MRRLRRRRGGKERVSVEEEDGSECGGAGRVKRVHSHDSVGPLRNADRFREMAIYFLGLPLVWLGVVRQGKARQGKVGW